MGDGAMPVECSYGVLVLRLLVHEIRTETWCFGGEAACLPQGPWVVRFPALLSQNKVAFDATKLIDGIVLRLLAAPRNHHHTLCVI